MKTFVNVFDRVDCTLLQHQKIFIISFTDFHRIFQVLLRPDDIFANPPLLNTVSRCILFKSTICFENHFVLMQYTIAIMQSCPGVIVLGMNIQMPMMQWPLADGFARVPRDVWLMQMAHSTAARIMTQAQLRHTIRVFAPIPVLIPMTITVTKM